MARATRSRPAKAASPSGSSDRRSLLIAVALVAVIVWFVASRTEWESFSHDRFWKLDRAFADPSGVYANEEFHIYTTSAAQCIPGNCPVYWVPHFVSGALSEPGTVRGDAMPDLPPWVHPDDRSIWAPSVTVIGGVYVMHFSATAGIAPYAGSKCLGAAVSATPDGPFIPLPDPLHCGPAGYWALDPYAFTDGIGAWFLLWREDDAANVTGKIMVAQLNVDGLSFGGAEAGPLLYGQFPWEEGYPDAGAAAQPAEASETDRQLPGAALPSQPGIGPIENPAMARHPETGEWLLAWSANRWETQDYATGLAVCQGPMGPCTAMSQQAPWLRTSSDPAFDTNAEFGGCGGLSFVDGPDEHLYAVFHAYRGDGGLATAPRVGWVYRVTVGDDGYTLDEFD